MMVSGHWRPTKEGMCLDQEAPQQVWPWEISLILIAFTDNHTILMGTAWQY